MHSFSISPVSAPWSPAARGASALMMARGLLQAGARVVISSRKADACEQAQADLARIRRRAGHSGRPVPARRMPAAGRSSSPRTAKRCTSWSTTRARHGVSRWRPSPTRRGTRCSISTSSRRSGWCRRCCPHFGTRAPRMIPPGSSTSAASTACAPASCRCTPTAAARRRCTSSPGCSPANSDRSTSP